MMPSCHIPCMCLLKFVEFLVSLHWSLDLGCRSNYIVKIVFRKGFLNSSKMRSAREKDIGRNKKNFPVTFNVNLFFVIAVCTHVANNELISSKRFEIKLEPALNLSEK